MSIRIIVNNNSAQASDSDCQKLEAAIVSKQKAPDEAHAKKLACALCQAGGTNKAQGNLSVTLVVPASSGTGGPSTEYKLSLKDLKDILRENNLKITLRQYARARAQDCHDVGMEFDIPGDLAKKLGHMYGPLSKEDAFWASSFQMDAEVCPANVKKLLIDHYNTIFKKG